MSRTLLTGTLLIATGWLIPGCGRPQTRPAAPRSAPAATQAAADAPASDRSSLEELRQTLVTTADSRVRVLTIDAIGTFGAGAEAALDDLIKATTDPEPRVRWHAARAIGLIGEDAIPAIPTLVTMLGDDDPITVAQAAAAIRAIRANDRRTTKPEKDAALYAATVEPLVKATVHHDARVRRAAVNAIRALDLPTGDLAARLGKVLADSQPSVILPALHTLADMDGDAVPVLIEALANPKARYWAAVGLTEIGPEAAPAVDGLKALAETGEPEERMQAMLALAAIGPEAASAGPVMLEALRADDQGVLRFAAAFALGKVRAKEADADLAKIAKNGDPLLATVAAWARARIHPDDKAIRAEALQALRSGLSSDVARVRAAATSGLADIAESLDEAGRKSLAPEFVKTLTDPDAAVETRGGAALIRLGSDAVETLRASLADAAVRGAILEILAAIGPQAKGAIPEITKALSDDDPSVRGDATMAIAAIGADAAAAVPTLKKILADENEDRGTRYSAAYALGRIGPAAASAIDQLHLSSASEDELMATVAVWAVLKIEPGKTEHFEAAMPRLRKALRSESDLARLEAAVALGEIGSAAATAVPMLEVIAEDDPVRAVRAAAGEALSKIRGS